MKKNLFDENFGKFDSINSTFRHEIFLTNKKSFVGYSKGLNLIELKDKDTLIQKVIIRLYKNGYLNKQSKGTNRETECIIFYTNDPIEPEWILTLYPLDYQISEDYVDNHNLINFLKRFYEMVRTGKEIKNLVKKPSQHKILSMDARFETTDELLNYCHNAKHKYGIAHGLVEEFYRNQMKKHFNK